METLDVLLRSRETNLQLQFYGADLGYAYVHSSLYKTNKNTTNPTLKVTRKSQRFSLALSLSICLPLSLCVSLCLSLSLSLSLSLYIYIYIYIYRMQETELKHSERKETETETKETETEREETETEREETETERKETETERQETETEREETGRGWLGFFWLLGFSDDSEGLKRERGGINHAIQAKLAELFVLSLYVSLPVSLRLGFRVSFSSSANFMGGGSHSPRPFKSNSPIETRRPTYW